MFVKETINPSHLNCEHLQPLSNSLFTDQYIYKQNQFETEKKSVYHSEKTAEVESLLSFEGANSSAKVYPHPLLYPSLVLPLDLSSPIAVFVSHSAAFTECLQKGETHFLKFEYSSSPFHSIRYIGYGFMQQVEQASPSFPEFLPINPEIVEATQKVTKAMTIIINVMNQRAHICECEIIQAICLLERATSKKISCQPIVLTLGNVTMAFLVAVMISHKFSSDSPVRNKWWADLFSVDVKDLYRSELIFLKTIDYNLYITPEEYNTAASSLNSLFTWPHWRDLDDPQLRKVLAS
ncbi:uncharacterized protein MONOS_5035 [Monocercomonoides exilis]|uniref:uncharacterized protein n=1 Tax=Monocercomonoides exilis TaxID=2049356 RepID=UPI003559DB8F|nr:hypothetical protein MONOS_5035 [Monocercomonoides exilis]|eukprot:MONOS_5035.1-p1 / transcript=MONOS_5035.1 / gene=MONOS_5035 / organism=Monocercomonoides_exilis_PA203 / gene_product=unspecified product / transcript_product=unspecified product / location=Mono_scaffold00142:42052-42933(-) / protein_length=293 / sequence_SO=supercontig / SO=protein_coding / is_pseudo=false